jgi:hypothetical protein
MSASQILITLKGEILEHSPFHGILAPLTHSVNGQTVHPPGRCLSGCTMDRHAGNDFASNRGHRLTK